MTPSDADAGLRVGSCVVKDPSSATGSTRPWSAMAAGVAIAFGILSGLGAFTFGYGQGASYLVDDPRGCANCHVMQGHYDSWQQSSHHGVATCNDCHLRHDNAVGKWMTKADNGFFHSLAFTLGDVPDPLRIKPRNRRVTQDACLHCHAGFVHELLPAVAEQETVLCIHCHQAVGHAQR